MSYEKFAQLLDAEDPVAQKAIDFIVQDVFTRARSRKQAIEEARQYHQPTYSSVAAAAAARRDQSGEQARRAWHGEVPSLSQRLHGWRYLNADDPDRQIQDDHQPEESTLTHGNADEYDAIIADAQRQVTSPLPMLGLGSSQQDSRSYHLDPLFDSLDWPDLNSSAAYGHEGSNGWSDSESETDNNVESRVQAVERALAAVQTQRDNSRTNLTRLSTISAASGVPTTSASRLRILQRLEQRRRDLMDRAEQQRSSVNNNRSYPSYFSTSFSRTPTDNTNSDQIIQNDPSIPIIVGGDFSNLPSSSSETRRDSDTIRANYGSLRRNNSIRRSGFHANRSQQSSPPNVAAATNAAHAILPHTTTRPISTLQPRSPLSLSRPINEPSDTYFSNGELRAHRNQLDTLFGRQGSEGASEQEASSQSRETNSFENFSRTSRQASRLAREDDNLDRTNAEDNGQAPSTSAIAALPRFLLSPRSDPMLGATPIDGDAVNEFLGSSSSVAGLGTLSSGRSSPSRVPYVASNGRRNIIPPRAPILSRRSFPLDGTTLPPIISTSELNTADDHAAAAGPSLGGQYPQRSNSVPARGQIYRREEILSLAQFLNEDSMQVLRNDD